MPKPKILIISTVYLPLIGGAELAVKEITDRLGNEYDFDLICARLSRKLSKKEKIGQVNIERAGSGFWWDKYILPFKAYKRAKKGNYGLIWAIMASYGAFAAQFIKTKKPGIRFLLTLQEGDSEEHILKRVGIFYSFWRRIFFSADYIQTISAYLADFARRHGAKCPIEIVSNGVDLELFGKTPPTGKLRVLNEKTPGVFPKSSKEKSIIITTSRLVHKNGIDILIRAVAQLKVISYKLKVKIVGGGPDEQKLKDLAEKLGVSDVIEFVGEVDSSIIPYYLLHSTLFVRPSRSEGLGTAFLEAMAAGLPIIGTNVGGIPDFLKPISGRHPTGKPPRLNKETSEVEEEGVEEEGVEEEANGLFVNVDDPSDLAKKITFLIKNPDIARQLGQNGRKLVLQKYSWDSIAGKMNNIFKKLTTYNLQLKTILIATGLYPPEIGGPATHTVTMEEELPRLGVRVTILPFSKVRQYPKVIRHFVYCFKCWFLALRHDLIFAQDTVSVGLPTSLAALFSGRPFVVRVPGDYIWEQAVQRWGVKENIDEFQSRRYGFRVEFFRAIQCFVVNQADVVVTPSDYFNKLVSGWVKDKSKVKTIYNGIDLAPFGKTPSVGENGKILVSVGRLVPWKGFDVLIEIMRDLPDWKLVIIGDGPEVGGLKLKVISYKLEERVKLTGALSREEVYEYLNKADIFILNTSFESFSFQTVEAMSIGLPVVVTNIGSLPEIVENGRSGVLVEPNNKDQILNAIKKIDSDKSFKEKISRNAYERAKFFSSERMVEELYKVFKSLNT